MVKLPCKMVHCWTADPWYLLVRSRLGPSGAHFFHSGMFYAFLLSGWLRATRRKPSWPPQCNRSGAENTDNKRNTTSYTNTMDMYSEMSFSYCPCTEKKSYNVKLYNELDFLL